jgi:hypothetical protein
MQMQRKRESKTIWRVCWATIRIVYMGLSITMSCDDVSPCVILVIIRYILACYVQQSLYCMVQSI